MLKLKSGITVCSIRSKSNEDLHPAGQLHPGVFSESRRYSGGGNYQTLINDALLEYVHRRSTLDVVRQAVREELGLYGIARQSNTARQPTRRARR